MRSETRGWVMPSNFAARAWVSFLSLMKETSARIIAERIRGFSASAGAKPRSVNTSLPAWIYAASFLQRLHSKCLLEPCPSEIDAGLGCLLALLAEGMQDVDGVPKPGHVGDPRTRLRLSPTHSTGLRASLTFV
jgi:hypothetical protein